MNNNSFPIIIPCHRVIRKNGKLTGYAYGLWRKEWLLLFEKQNLQEQKINSSDLLKSLRIINKTQKPT
jgi:alkylated DNA nucleotide flippase Atl1